MKIFKSIICILLSVQICGCSIFVPTTQKLEINGNHADAKVVVNGKEVKVPAVVEVPRDKKVFIVITKDGYYPCYETVNTTLSPWGFLDIAGGWLILVPFIGLVFPGSHQLEQDNLYFVLHKDNSSEKNIKQQ